MITSKRKGNRALASAISYYSLLDYPIALPLGDTEKYDMIIEENKKLLKVQCKYTGSLNKKATKNISFNIPLYVCGGNRSSGNNKILYENGDFDILYVLTTSGDRYIIPFDDMAGKIVIATGAYQKYKVG
jgi:hypothetical protein